MKDREETFSGPTVQPEDSFYPSFDSVSKPPPPSPTINSGGGGWILIPFIEEEIGSDPEIYTFPLSHTTQTQDPVFIFLLKNPPQPNTKQTCFFFPLPILKGFGLAKETTSLKDVTKGYQNIS